MKFFRVFVSVCLLIFFLSAFSTGKIVHRDLDSDDDFVYIGRFCYASDPLGYVLYSFNMEHHEKFEFMGYRFNQWKEVYHNDDMSCEEKLELAVNHITIMNSSMHTHVVNMGRPEFLFFAVADCESGSPFKGSYDIDMYNSETSWRREISYDEQPMYPRYFFFFFLYFGHVVFNIIGAFQFLRMKSYHPLAKLFSGGLFLQFLRVLFGFIHYAMYTSNGIGSPFFDVMSVLSSFVSEICLMILLVALGQGWCISKKSAAEKHNHLMRLKYLAAMFVVLSILVLIWYYSIMDDASTRYSYSNVPGILLLFIRCIILCWFVLESKKLYEAEKNSFIKRFILTTGIAGGLWFFSLPMVIIIGALTGPIKRYAFVRLWDIIATTLMISYLQFSFWPSRAMRVFNFTPEDLKLIPNTIVNPFYGENSNERRFLPVETKSGFI